MRMTLKKTFLIFCLTIAVTGSARAEGETYFASLKKNEVNLRAGPGEKFPIIWVYQENGYPVEVIDKYDIWRQIREADGTIGWVHRVMIGRSRTALIQEEGFLTDKPAVNGKNVAIVQQGTIGKILRCPAGNEYCLLSFKYRDRDVKGWFPRRFFWGLYPDEEID